METSTIMIIVVLFLMMNEVTLVLRAYYVTPELKIVVVTRA